MKWKNTHIFRVSDFAYRAGKRWKDEAGRGAAARGVTAKPTGCGFDPHSRR